MAAPAADAGDTADHAAASLERSVLTALAADGPAYAVRDIEFIYANEHPDLPVARSLKQLTVELLQTPSGYVAPREGANNVQVRLSELQQSGVELMHASAASAIASAVVRNVQERGLIGVVVSPDPTQIQAAFTPDGSPVWGEDLRGGSDQLRMIVRCSNITLVRTVAQGNRPLEGSLVNNPAHSRIRSNSPLGVGDLVSRDDIDDYIYDLNRHPGRSVAAEIFSGADASRGDAGLGFIVSEAKPWTAFFNLSNTGTRETREWRERFGLLHTQLTGKDRKSVV